ncbi:MlaD family protein [Nocardia acidivorans]|uniref:MlaD family protein n=1 Tax=Nocardia acidivorans TaxID=404580 RepID=UPI0008323734|nr:MlaD family protein [Nocardia acidivorans]
MQALTRLFVQQSGGGSAQDEEQRELRWGVFGALSVVALLIVCGVIYALPLGTRTYTALLSEAGSVRVGDDVRVAGIPVGSVTSIELLPDEARMRFDLADEVFVGADTTLEVRMLTAVGGNYVAVLPAGVKPLGKQVIPANRVRLPYSLMQVFQDAATPLHQVNGDVLQRNLAVLQKSLSDNPDSIRRLSDALSTVVGILDQQRTDIAATLTMAEEYLNAVGSAKTTIGRLMGRIGGVEKILIGKRDEINAAVPLTIQLLSRVAALEPTYRNNLQPLVDEFAKALPDLQKLGEHLNGMVATIGDLSARIGQHGVSVDQSAATVCIPLPGKGC